MSRYLCDGIELYLTEEAHSALTMLMERGFDKDLAFEILSRTTPEDELYDIPKDKVEATWTE